KDPAQTTEDELEEMIATIRTTAGHAMGIAMPTAFAFWRELYERQSQWAAAAGTPPLLAHFGTSLLERALIDAVARANGTTFAAALATNALGVDLGALRPDLGGSIPRDWLGSPLPRVFARHTVGLADPIEAADVAPGE